MALVPWAVSLVYEHRVGDIVHLDVLEMHVGGRADRRCGPCLNPHAIGPAADGAILDKDTHHGLFVRVLPEAADADAVARTAVHPLDKDLLAPVTNGDAIVPGLDGGVNNIDPDRSSDVDPVCVEAVARRGHGEMLERHVLAAQDVYVELLAIERRYVVD